PMITAIERNQYGILSEQEQKILISYNDELYRESIIIIAKSISAKVNIDFIQGEEKKKKRFFGR
ncbi:hypothetical protein B5V91_14310, partial [Heyndrickxia sporothermodurans]